MSFKFSPSTLTRAALFVLLCCLASSATSQEQQAHVDPRLRLAKLTRDELVLQQKQLDDALAGMVSAIENSVANFEPARLADPELTLRSFKPIVKELRELSKTLIEQEDAYVKALQSMQGILKDAPDAYMSAAKAFRQYADEETFADTKQDYILLAEAWEKAASLKREQLKMLTPQSNSEIDNFLKYVKRTALYLERFEIHLDSLPEAEGEEGRTVYLAQLKRYVRGMEELRRLFRSFHQKLHNTSSAKKPRPAATDQFVAKQLTHISCPIETVQDGDWAAIREQQGFSPMPGDVLAFYHKGWLEGQVQVRSVKRGIIVINRISGNPMQDGSYVVAPSNDPSRPLLEEVERRAYQFVNNR